jgi:hypothetical protein
MPPRPPQHDPQYLDEHHQRISEFASEYFDDDEEREAFVDTLLERRGYQRTTGWSQPADPGPGPQGGGGGAGGARPPAAPRRPAYFRR